MKLFHFFQSFAKNSVRLLATFTISLACVTASAADLKEIRDRGVIRHLDIKYANFVTADGKGFDVELVQGFAKHLGVRYVLAYSDFVSVIRDLLGLDVVRKGDEVSLAGDYPVRGDIIATGFTVLPWREKVLLYSAPTFPSQVLLVARTESEHKPIPARSELRAEIAETKRLIGKHSLLVMEKTCLDPGNYGLENSGYSIRPFTANTNLDEMVPTLLRGDAEFTLLDVPDAVINLQRWASRIKIIGPIS